jgi:hypothetical protein
MLAAAFKVGLNYLVSIIFGPTNQLSDISNMNSLSKKIGIIFAGFALLLVALAQTAVPEQHTIDFSVSNGLKTIYDAGLRPWKYSPSESISCDLGPENLKIILPQDKNFTFKIESANIDVLSDGQISRISLNGAYIPLSEAAEQIQSVCDTLGISTGSFNDYVNEIQKQEKATPAKAMMATVNGIKIDIGFDRPLPVDPHTRVWIVMTWPRPNPYPKITGAPIHPPPGYEDVSMDPPPNPSYIKPDPNFPNYYQKPAQNSPSVLASSNPAANSSVALNPAVKPTSSPASVPAPPSAAPLVAYRWLLALLVLALGAWWLLRRK